jgi:peptidoglycan/xylan/chitin deacetylase (PgdA/CDA1 family)
MFAKSLKSKALRATTFAVIGMAAASNAGPITTVPWNGYPGAVSFTFDDACASQLSNVVPALKARKIHGTFFLYNSGGAFTGNKSAWLAAAQDGNELANHTLDHLSLSDASTNATQEVDSMAHLLRAADTSIQAVTLAYPGCAVGHSTEVGAENFLARSCLFSAPYNPLPWKSQPSDWLSVAAIYNADDATATGPVITAIDAAKNGGWISTLNHGVGGDWLAVTPANVAAMFDRAIQDGLWIGTYQEVGSYWRASFAMDKATASGTGPWTVTWSSPHPKMPRGVKLKVKLDATTFGSSPVVSQGGMAISPNSDGSYTVEFMKLSMSISKATDLSDRRILGRMRVESSGASVLLEGLAPGAYRLEFRGMDGSRISTEDVSTTGTSRQILPSACRGRAFLAILSRSGKDASVAKLAAP